MPDGAKVVKKLNLDVDDMYGGLIKKKSKRKGGGAGGPASAAGGAVVTSMPKAIKLKYSPEDFTIWEKLGFKPPLASDECPALHEQLLSKREWLKTAPPKQKKPKPDRTDAEAEASQAPADRVEVIDAGPEYDAAAYKKQEAEELKKKQEAERKKADEKAKLDADNLAKMQALEGAGKTVAGGMHKFDASEVDVHGGNATADDFMDAFGFGDVGDASAGDESGEMEEAASVLESQVRVERTAISSSLAIRAHLRRLLRATSPVGEWNRLFAYRARSDLHPRRVRQLRSCATSDTGSWRGG